MTESSDGADVVLINTCAFIDPAKEESVEAIMAGVAIKRESGCLLAVCGCMPERYRDELEAEIPEIDLLAGADDAEGIVAWLDGIDRREPSEPSVGRVRLTPGHYAYLKISEGCDKRCAFCAIPGIRGPMVSRPIDELLSEAEELAASGAKELILVAQDSGEYGRDLYGRRMLPELLRRLDGVSGVAWVRLMYVYPETIDDALLSALEKSEKALRYLDVPFQHASDPVLSRMGRPSTRADIDELLARIRERLPGVAIRSGFIAGFPGETEEDVDSLESFLRSADLARVGVFEFSPEEGTRAREMTEQVPPETAAARRDRLMALAEDLSEARLAGMVGTELDVIIEEEEEAGVYSGRSYMDAPEVDGAVYVHSGSRLEIGGIIKVKIVDSLTHDLIGVPKGES
jgi:ribosomal protein S12 methylthiotransferase